MCCEPFPTLLARSHGPVTAQPVTDPPRPQPDFSSALQSKCLASKESKVIRHWEGPLRRVDHPLTGLSDVSVWDRCLARARFFAVRHMPFDGLDPVVRIIWSAIEGIQTTHGVPKRSPPSARATARGRRGRVSPFDGSSLEGQNTLGPATVSAVQVDLRQLDIVLQPRNPKTKMAPSVLGFMV